jgi:hypothetical protein
MPWIMAPRQGLLRPVRCGLGIARWGRAEHLVGGLPADWRGSDLAGSPAGPLSPPTSGFRTSPGHFRAAGGWFGALVPSFPPPFADLVVVLAAWVVTLPRALLLQRPLCPNPTTTCAATCHQARQPGAPRGPLAPCSAPGSQRNAQTHADDNVAMGTSRTGSRPAQWRSDRGLCGEATPDLVAGQPLGSTGTANRTGTRGRGRPE